MTYCELQTTTHYSFLARRLLSRAIVRHRRDVRHAGAGRDGPQLGRRGWVRALVAAEQISQQGFPIRMIAGCRLDLVDGTSLLVWPEDRAAWSRLTRLLTLGKGRARCAEGREGAMLPALGRCCAACRWPGRRDRARPDRNLRAGRSRAALDGGRVRRARACLPDAAPPARRRPAAVRARPEGRALSA